MPLKKASDIREIVNTKYKDLTKTQEEEISKLIDDHLKSDSTDEFIDTEIDLTPELKADLVSLGYVCNFYESIEKGQYTKPSFYRIDWISKTLPGIKPSGKTFDDLQNKKPTHKTSKDAK